MQEMGSLLKVVQNENEGNFRAIYYHYPALGKPVQMCIDFNYIYFLLFLKHQGSHTSWEFWGNCQLVFPSKTALLSKAATQVCLLVFCG